VIAETIVPTQLVNHFDEHVVCGTWLYGAKRLGVRIAEGDTPPIDITQHTSVEKESSGVRLQVLLAIIALISALGVALIGIVPDLIDRLSPVPTSTETPDLTWTERVCPGP
jgi:hypothetical protein